ncbi:hypothetical protein RUM43_014015 [Polyplax serrata]|uniref:Uncharacterized protein n=1 Tax=Polyplax serrata TaxID=468196 RepID=A0AAN8PSY6_POLSC
MWTSRKGENPLVAYHIEAKCSYGAYISERPDPKERSERKDTRILLKYNQIILVYCFLILPVHLDTVICAMKNEYV